MPRACGRPADIKRRSVTTADGRTLTVREGGDPSGVPVLTISGTPGSSTLYEPHAEGLDFFAGMGEQNIEEFKLAHGDDEGHKRVSERNRADLLATKPAQPVELWQTMLGPADREVATDRLAAFLLDHFRAGIEPSGEGWFDDDLVFVRPWEFDLASIRIPVLLLQGEQDKFVPYGHGVWLSEHIPGVETRLTAEDGHLTLAEHRVPEVHEWLLARYAPTDATDAQQRSRSTRERDRPGAAQAGHRARHGA